MSPTELSAAVTVDAAEVAVEAASAAAVVEDVEVPESAAEELSAAGLAAGVAAAVGEGCCYSSWTAQYCSRAEVHLRGSESHYYTCH